jgi:Tfp pilus assembly protein PilN
VRPVNLIPAEDRRGGPKKSARTGPAVYLIIGGLVLVLGAVTLMVTTQNRISDSQAQITSLQQQEQAATARADSLKPYAEFASTQQLRTATVASLAQSRFDWERVLRELALVIPQDVTVQNLTGTASPGVAIGTSDLGDLRDQIPGPALALDGCANGQDGVAALIAALQDIDGVTRVGLSNTKKDGSVSAGSASTASVTKPCIGGTHFTIVVAFDDALVATPAPSNGTTTAPAAPATTAPAPTTTTTPTGTDGGVSQAAQQQADAASSIQQGAQAAESAINSTQGR